MARNRKSASTGKAVEKAVGMVPGRNGHGRIWRGAPASPVAGTGRPKDIVRERLLGLTDEGIEFVGRLIKGEVTLSIKERCEFCEKEPTNPTETILEALEKVKVETRLRAWVETAALAVGKQDEVRAVPTDDGRARFQQTILVLSNILPKSEYERVCDAIEPIWEDR